MHPFSFIVIASAILNLCLNKSMKKALIVQTGITIFICSFVNVGYFFESELINIDYYQAAILLNFLVAVLGRRQKIALTKNCFCYLACLLLSVVLLAVWPSSSANVTGLSSPRFEDYMVGNLSFSHPVFSKYTVFFLVLAVCVAFIVDTIGRLFTREDWIKTLQIVVKLGRILLIVVCFEIAIKYILGSNLYSSFIVSIFGEGTSTYLTLVSRGSFRMLQGLTRESSHFAYGMMLLIILLFIDQKAVEKKNTPWLVIALLALLLSGAFSMVWCVAFLAAYYLVAATYHNTNGVSVSGKRAAVLLMVAMAAFFAIGIVGITLIQSNDYLASRFSEVLDVISGITNNNVNYYATLSYVTSSQSRLFSLYYTFVEWLKRPLFGFGLGTTSSYSYTMLTLGETGLVTLVAMWRFYIRVMKKYCANIAPCAMSLALWYGCNLLSGIQSRLIVAMDVLIIMGSCIVLFGNGAKETVATSSIKEEKNNG